MNISEARKELVKHKAATDAFKKQLKEVVTDQSLPLKARWNLFIESGLGEHESSLIHLSCLNEGKFKSWCRNPIEDNFYDGKNRGDVDIDHWFEYLSDIIGEEFTIQSAHDSPKKKVTFEQSDLEAFQEEALKQFVKSYAFDW